MVLRTSQLAITVKHEGDLPATNLAAASLSAPFSFKGGTFPGTGGTCGSQLLNDQCTVVLTFNPNAAGDFTDSLSFDFKMDGSQNLSRPLEGSAGVGFNGAVNHIAVAKDGSHKIYVGGNFMEFNGITAYRIARLTADLKLDPTFDVGDGFNGEVKWIEPAIDGSDDVYVGGYFTSYDGVSIRGLARLNSDGSLDTAFQTKFFSYCNPSLDPINCKLSNPITGGNPNNPKTIEVLAAAPDGSGNIYVGGTFGLYGGVYQPQIVRIGTNGDADGTWGGYNSWTTRAITPLNDGTGEVYMGGYFTPRFMRLKIAGSWSTSAPSTMPNMPTSGGMGFNQGSEVSSILPMEDGSKRVYVAGSFTGFCQLSCLAPVNFIPYNAFRFARMAYDGTFDQTFSPGAGFNAWVSALKPAGDGSQDIYAGGTFTTYNGQPASKLVRLHADGSRNLSFNPTVPMLTATTIAVSTDGSGDIYTNSTTNHIMRFSPDGAIH